MKRWTLAVVAFVGLGLMAQPAQAQGGLQFGPQLVYGDDADLGFGARVHVPLGNAIAEEGILSAVTAILEGNYYLGPDCDPVDCSYMDFNANGVIPLQFGEGFAPYAGAGLHFARVSAEYMGQSTSDSEFGLNVVGGAQFLLGSFNAVGQATLNLGGAEQLVLAIAILFGDVD